MHSTIPPAPGASSGSLNSASNPTTGNNGAGVSQPAPPQHNGQQNRPPYPQQQHGNAQAYSGSQPVYAQQAAQVQQQQPVNYAQRVMAHSPASQMNTNAPGQMNPQQRPMQFSPPAAQQLQNPQQIGQRMQPQVQQQQIPQVQQQQIPQAQQQRTHVQQPQFQQQNPQFQQQSPQFQQQQFQQQQNPQSQQQQFQHQQNSQMQQQQFQHQNPQQHPQQQNPHHPPQQQFPSPPPPPMQRPRPSYESLAPQSASTVQSPNQQQNAPKIPQDQVPSPIDFRALDQETFNTFGMYKTASEIPPPLSTTEVPIVDDGNCHPAFMRVATFKFPASQEIVEQCAIPLSVVIQPFALKDDSFIPQIDCTSSTDSITRCKNCMAYLNPFVILAAGGSRYRCNLCMHENQMTGEQNYNTSYSDTSFQRAELKSGTVEFIVPPEYILRPQVQGGPFLIFAIDVSKQETLPFFLQAVRRCCNYLASAASPYCKVSLVAYEKQVHFVNFSIPGAPSIVSVADLDGDFCPIWKEEMFLSPSERINDLLDILDLFPSLFATSTGSDCSFASTLRILMNSTKDSNGKIAMFNSTFFGTGPGALALRDDISMTPEKEKASFTSISPELNELAVHAANNGISVDLFAVSAGAFLDLASIGVVSSISGGELHYYPAASLGKGECLEEDVIRCISSCMAFDCSAKMRTSNGISVADNFGNLYMRTASEMLFGAVPQGKAFSCLLNVDEKLPERSKVSLQFAILYTNREGIRKVRVHNLCLPIANSVADVFANADAEVIATFLCKRAISLTTTSTLPVIRDLLNMRLSSILAAYRKNCSSSTANSQLVLPESLKVLPIYILALMKSKAFSPAAIKSDLRVYWFRMLNSLCVKSMSLLFYPKLYCLTATAEQQQHSSLLPLSYASIEEDHIYCLTNGIVIVVLVGKNCKFLPQIFGVESLAAIDVIACQNVNSLPALSNALSHRVRSQIRLLQEADVCSSARFAQLLVVRQGIDPMEAEFHSMMVADPVAGLPSYVDYLCSLHATVKNALQSGGKK